MVRLEQLRRQKPMTQRELAEAAGVSENTVWVIENNRHRTLRPRIMRALAAALGVLPAEVDEFRRVIEGGSAQAAKRAA